MTSPRALKVSLLVHLIKTRLEELWPDVTVEGEISNWTRASSGHCYFSIKDDGAVLSCVMWKAGAMRLAKEPRDGDKVEVRGRVSVYEKRGQFQLIVDSLKPTGEGDLWRRFTELKERLGREGLFDEERKRPLPSMPSCIGIVTSATGAALRDMLNVLARRAPGVRILIWPARVQGTGAAQEIADGVKRLAGSGLVEVLIVGRGGGSFEDLWEFNDEGLARAIVASPVPVISAVGHETDFSISDFAADLRAPTPSAAAELVCAEYDASRQAARVALSRLDRAVGSRLALTRKHLGGLLGSYAFRQPEQRLRESQQRVDDLSRSLDAALGRNRDGWRGRLANAASALRGHDPGLILRKGYAVVRRASDDRIIKKSSDVRVGMHLMTEFAEGRVRSITVKDEPDLFEV